MKRTIRLNEGQIRRIVSESVKRVLRENYDYDFANDTLSGQNDFMKDYRASAHKFSHDGADAYFARKEQDKMHKNERRRKSYANKKINQFANTDMGLNKELRESVKNVLREGYNNFGIGKACDFRDTMDSIMNGGSKYNIYTVFVGGGEANDYLLSYEDAVKLAREYADEGYDDVQVVNTKTNKVEKF